MEAMLLHSSPDQSISSYKQIRNSKKTGHGFNSRSSEKFPVSDISSSQTHGGILFAPPQSLSYSLPPSLHLVHQFHRQPPPLLPLPISRSYSSLPSRTQISPSSSPINRKINRKRDQSLTPNKSKPSVNSKKEVSIDHLRSITPKTAKPESSIIESPESLRPDRKDLLKNLSRSSSSSTSFINAAAMNDLESPGLVFTLSPPPSSLPLPKFSMKPKLRCNAEASGVDDGATDNLRRLLRL